MAQPMQRIFDRLREWGAILGIAALLGLAATGMGGDRDRADHVDDRIWASQSMAELAEDRIYSALDPASVKFDGETWTIAVRSRDVAGAALAAAVCAAIADVPGTAGSDVRIVDQATTNVLDRLDHHDWPIVLGQATC